MSDLEHIKNNLLNYQSSNKQYLVYRDKISNYFQELFLEKVEVKNLNNNLLIIKVPSAALASEINLQKSKIIKDLNNLLKDKNKINNLVIYIS